MPSHISGAPPPLDYHGGDPANQHSEYIDDAYHRMQKKERSAGTQKNKKSLEKPEHQNRNIIISKTQKQEVAEKYIKQFFR